MDDLMLWFVLFLAFGIAVGLIVGWGKFNMALEARHERQVTASVSTVSVKPVPPPTTDGQTDRQTDLVFALIEAMHQKQLDRTRALIIDNAVVYGWDVGRVRALLKGDNATIGDEVKEARQRLGVDPEPRPVVMNDATGKRVIDLNSGKRIA